MSKNFNISDLQEYLNEDVLLKYINNQLSDEDVEKVEFLLQHDKMYSDLLDGLMMLDEPEDIIYEKVELNKKIDTFSRNKKKQMARNYNKFRSIAAVALIFLVCGIVFMIFYDPVKDNEQISKFEFDSGGYLNIKDYDEIYYLEETPVLESTELDNEKGKVSQEIAGGVYRNITEELSVVDDDKIVENLEINIEADRKTGNFDQIMRSVESEEEEHEEDLISYLVVEQKPEFPGGETALTKFLSENLVYPSDAKENGIQGRVLVQFVIDANGKVSDIKVVRGVSPSLDEEAVRVIKLLPDWTPGTQRGKAVSVSFMIPINFKL